MSVLRPLLLSNCLCISIPSSAHPVQRGLSFSAAAKFFITAIVMAQQGQWHHWYYVWEHEDSGLDDHTLRSGSIAILSVISQKVQVASGLSEEHLSVNVAGVHHARNNASYVNHIIRMTLSSLEASWAVHTWRGWYPNYKKKSSISVLEFDAATITWIYD